MENNHIEIWRECLKVIKDNTQEQAFKTWFKPIVPVSLKDNILTIQVPSQFFYEWLEEHYIDLLRTTIKKVLGDSGKLEYKIIMDSSDNSYTMVLPGSSRGNTKNPIGRAPVENLSQNIVNPFIIPGLRKLQIDSQLNENYTFDNFVEGECNRVARQGGLEVAKNPGKTVFNPLLIYSGTGLGKTHLCHAIGNEIKRLYPQKTVLYVQAEQFLNQWATASKNNNQNDFVHFYQMIDVIIIDDIQFLAKKPSTQDVFFHIFNYLHQNNKQLVITSDKLPADLKDIAPRLLSRFKWGLTTDLQMPDADTRTAILRNKLYNNGIVFPDEIISYLATNVRTNVRELEGVLISLVAQSSLNKKAVTIDLAQNIIERFIRNSVKEVSVEYIINMVCEYFSISPEQMALNTRKHQVVQARQIAMYLSKKYSSASLNSIGQQCGKKDHATVYHACKTVSDRLETDKQFKMMLADIEKKMAI
ncbi:MAG: chromosomal replication initiator protein DnaA [Bacteroidales bacterium]|nr:chromosomal replication initiator protein DnaA [Bacteroidales bacterium]